MSASVPPNSGNNRAQPPNAALAQIKPADNTAIELIKATDPDLGKRVLQIMLSQPANKTLSAPRALAAAMYEKDNPGRRLNRDFYVDEKMGVVPSYRGDKKDAEGDLDNEFYTQFRSMTAAENTEHDVVVGDTSIVCEGYQFAMMRRLQQLGMPYKPTIGIGIVREYEKFTKESRLKWTGGDNGHYEAQPRDRWQPAEPPVGKSWRWKAEQRAYKDCLRHMPGIRADAQEILDDAGVEVDWDFEPSREQAVAVVASDRLLREVRSRPADEVAAELAEIRRQREIADHAFDDPPIEATFRKVTTPADALAQFPDAPPTGQVLDGDAPEYDACADFDAIPSATEERSAALQPIIERANEIRERILSTVNRDKNVYQPSDKQIKYCHGALGNLCAESRDRHAILLFLFDAQAVDDLGSGEVSALIDWIGSHKAEDGHWYASEQATADAAVILEARRALAGQTALPLDA